MSEPDLVLTGWWGPMPDKIAECIESIRWAYPDATVLRFPAVKNPRNQSDRIRFGLVSTMPGVLWLDCDIMMGPGPLVLPDGPACGAYWGSAKDYYLLWSGNNPAAFLPVWAAGEACGWHIPETYRQLQLVPAERITSGYEHLRWSKRQYVNILA